MLCDVLQFQNCFSHFPLLIKTDWPGRGPEKRAAIQQPAAAKRHFRAIITEMRIFQRAFAKKILAAPPNFCPLSRAKLCKYTNFVGFAPAEAFCVAPRGCNARGAAAPQRRFFCCPCGVFREGAAKGFEEAVCFF